MTLKEILKAKGLSDEDIESVIGEMKQNKIFTASEENLDVRYSKLKTDHDNLTAQHTESTKLIEQFKAEAKGNEALQGKLTAYETQIADLTKQLNDQRLDAAMDRKLTLAGAKPEDFDYLKFQWRKKGEITLDDNGEIKDGDDAVTGLKTQYGAQFASATNPRVIEPRRLPGRNGGNDTTITKEDFNKMGYNSRVKLKEENPELYAQLMKG